MVFLKRARGSGHQLSVKGVREHAVKKDLVTSLVNYGCECPRSHQRAGFKVPVFHFTGLKVDRSVNQGRNRLHSGEQ